MVPVEQFEVNFFDRLIQTSLERRLRAAPIVIQAHNDLATLSALGLADPVGVMTKGHAEVDWAGCYHLLIRRNAGDLMETVPGTSSALAVLHLGCVCWPSLSVSSRHVLLS